MADELPGSVAEIVEIVTPVPVHSSRLRSRGYNQSQLLAESVSRNAVLPLSNDLLQRTRDASPQARSGSIEQRARNVENTFAVTGNVQDRAVLLVDDVMTTGATLNSCAKALKEAGASWVGALVLAREL